MKHGRHLCSIALAWLPAIAVAAPPVVEPDETLLPRGTDDEGLPPPPDDAPPDEADLLEPPEPGEGVWEERVRAFDEHLERGRKAARAEDYALAELEYSEALRLQYNDSTALVGRAHARFARTPAHRCPTTAIADLLELERHDPKGAWLEQRAQLVAWMGQCGAAFAGQRFALVQELAAQPAGTRGRPDDIRVVLAELLLEQAASEDRTSASEDQRRVALHELERYRQECEQAGVSPAAAALRRQAELYRQFDQLSRAVATLEELHAIYGGDDVAFELELSRLEATQGYRPTPAAEEAYREGVAALGRGDLSAARAALTEAIEQSPWFPRAYYVRGSVLARLGMPLEAVDDLKRAVRMDRSDYRPHVMLGMIYKKEFAGTQDAEAIVHLDAALRLRPDLHRLHLELGELYAARDRHRSRQHYERYIDAVPFDDPDAPRARRALEELEREIRQEAPLVNPPPQEALRFVQPELQRMINEAYLRGTEYQSWAEAQDILMEARRRFPEEPVVLNELARVAYAQDRRGDAEAYWRESLAMREGQGEVHERLGLVLRSVDPDGAIEHLLQAADLGSPTARFVAAQLLWDRARPFAASAELDRYLADASPYDLNWERAKTLRAELDRRFLQLYAVAAAFAALLLGVPTWRMLRRQRGTSLSQLLARAPKTYPDVARAVSLIRHEILKHNTAFLHDVGSALLARDPGADERAVLLARRLFGTPRQGRDNRPEGVYGRLLGYVATLDAIARAHGVRLNLRRKDPIFRPILATFEDLARRAPKLQRCDRLSASRKQEMGRVLERAGKHLGRDAFVALSQLLEELCIVRVDAQLLEGVFSRVAAEEAFEKADILPLEVRGEPASIRVFRSDLEDILQNVLRNSLQSSINYGVRPVALGVVLETESDPITGLESLAIRIRDRSGEPLTNEMLRGRYVERGMGITVDLLSRYDGSISVEPADDIDDTDDIDDIDDADGHAAAAKPASRWTKAVVLRFFAVEGTVDELAAGASS